MSSGGKNRGGTTGGKKGTGEKKVTIKEEPPCDRTARRNLRAAKLRAAGFAVDDAIVVVDDDETEERHCEATPVDRKKKA